MTRLQLVILQAADTMGNVQNNSVHRFNHWLIPEILLLVSLVDSNLHQGPVVYTYWCIYNALEKQKIHIYKTVHMHLYPCLSPWIHLCNMNMQMIMNIPLFWQKF